MDDIQGRASAAVLLTIIIFSLVTESAHIPTPGPILIPTSTVKPVPPPQKPCTDFNQHIDSDGKVIYQTAQGTNCSGDDISIKETKPSKIEQWKTNVIIICTVTAAVEVVIVVIIVLYWKQIRWSLRKIKCPCDESERERRRRRRTSQPVPMGRNNPESQRHSNRNRSHQSNNTDRQNEQAEASEALVASVDPGTNQSSLFSEEPHSSGNIEQTSESLVLNTYTQSESNIPDSAAQLQIETAPV